MESVLAPIETKNWIFYFRVDVFQVYSEIFLWDNMNTISINSAA